MIVTAMLDSTSKRKQREQDSGRQQSFSKLLADETERLNEQHSMDGKAISYARNGQVIVGQPLSRAYN